MSNNEQLSMLIDGSFISGASSTRGIPVINPADTSVLGMLPLAGEEEVQFCIDAAAKAFDSWKKTSPVDRGVILKNAANRLRVNSESIATTITKEVGKPLREARVEVDVAAATLDWFAEEGRRAYGRILPSRVNGTKFHIVKEPIGVVASLAPWNFPTINAARKIGSALAAGCTCIHKPAEEAPGAALAVAKALVDSGLPKNVLSVIFGNPPEITSQLTSSRKVKKISFTGSVPVGKHIMKLCADGGQRTTMELGGHAPVIINNDVDVDYVAKLSVSAKYRNSGQVCVSPTRFLIHKNIYDEFLEKFIFYTSLIKVGNGLDPETGMGPLAHERRVYAIDNLVQKTIKDGATLSIGGGKCNDRGYYFSPTVLSSVPTNSFAMNEEPFGPVALINKFEDIDEALLESNRLPLGLAAFAFSDSQRVINHISDNLESGMLGINSFILSIPDSPFLGIKDSGHGAENGIEGLEACMLTKLITYS